jgi:hypothetical protein
LDLDTENLSLQQRPNQNQVDGKKGDPCDQQAVADGKERTGRASPIKSRTKSDPAPGCDQQE